MEMHPLRRYAAICCLRMVLLNYLQIVSMIEGASIKRDMKLVRLIPLKIEEEYHSTTIYNLNISGYNMETVAYHCKILNEAGLISDYGAQYVGNSLQRFGAGSLTWEGNDFLDKIQITINGKKDTITHTWS